MQVRMALTPNSLARRKSGVQVPSPPPHNSPGDRPGGSHPPGRRQLAAYEASGGDMRAVVDHVTDETLIGVPLPA